MNDTQKRYTKWLLAVVLVVVLGYLGYSYPLPAEPDAEAKAVERVGILCATESGNCVESWNGSDMVGYSDGGSTQTWAIDGATGDLDSEGDLDFAGDLEIGGVQTVDFNEFGTDTIVSTTTTNLVEIFDTTNVMTGGVNSLAALNIDLGVGNSTGGTNSVYGLLVDGISQDAQNTETAVSVQAGWDVAAEFLGAVNVGVDGTSYDVTFYSDTAGDTLLWDQDAEALTITGTDGQDALNVDDGNVDIADNVDIDGTTNVQGAVTFQSTLFQSFGNETITDGETLTPTLSTYALDSAGAVTMTLAASGTEGQFLVLIGDDANDIIIADTNVRTSTGAALTLNQYDVVGFVYQDSEWLELFLITNS